MVTLGSLAVGLSADRRARALDVLHARSVSRRNMVWTGTELILPISADVASGKLIAGLLTVSSASTPAVGAVSLVATAWAGSCPG